MARMVLLGVGTGLPDADRDHTHMVWDGPGGTLLIDAGGSTYQRLLRAAIDPQHLGGIVLTHSHADHINGLPGLLFSMALGGRRGAGAPLPIYGLAPTLERAQRLVAACELEEYAPEIVWTPINAGDGWDLGEGWRVRTALTQHSRPCIALRFEDGTRALTYSCDTAPCEAVVKLAYGSDILIHEATTRDPFPSHTTPEQAGEIANLAAVKRLVLVHFSPRWTMPKSEALAAVQAGGFAGQAEIGEEFQSLEW